MRFLSRKKQTPLDAAKACAARYGIPVTLAYNAHDDHLCVDISHSRLDIIYAFIDELNISSPSVCLRCYFEPMPENKDVNGFFTDAESVGKQLLRDQGYLYLGTTTDTIDTVDMATVKPLITKRSDGRFDIVAPQIKVKIEGSNRNNIPFGRVTGALHLTTDRNSVKGLPAEVDGAVYLTLTDDAEARYFVQNWKITTPETCYLLHLNVPNPVVVFTPPLALIPNRFCVHQDSRLELDEASVQELLYYRIGINYFMAPEKEDADVYDRVLTTIAHHHQGQLWRETDEQLPFALRESYSPELTAHWLRRYNSSKETGCYLFEGVLLDHRDITNLPANVLPEHAKRIEFDSCSKITDLRNLPKHITELHLTDCVNLKFYFFMANVEKLSLDVEHYKTVWPVTLHGQQKSCRMIEVSRNIDLQLYDIATLCELVNAGTWLSIRTSGSEYDSEDFPLPAMNPAIKLWLEYQETNDLLTLIAGAEAYFERSWPTAASLAPLSLLEIPEIGPL